MTRPKAEICSRMRMSRFGLIAAITLLPPLLMRAEEVRSGNTPARTESALDFSSELDSTEMPAELTVANELDAVTICQGYVGAQIEYSHQIHDEWGRLEYAQRITSSPGKQDGLRQISQQSAQGTLAIGPGGQSSFRPEADPAQKDSAQVDQALQHDVQQQLATSTSFQNVEVRVSNGVVHLGGPVPSQGDKKRAVDLVKAVPGVTHVNEDLTVDGRDVAGATATADAKSNAELNPETAGAALASQIALAMHDEPSLADSQVYVTVKGDVIELTGTVPGKKERRKAKEVASAFAINQHIVNKLAIAPRGDAKK